MASTLTPDTGGKHAPADRGRHITVRYGLTLLGKREMAFYTLLEQDNACRYVPPLPGEPGNESNV